MDTRLTSKRVNRRGMPIFLLESMTVRAAWKFASICKQGKSLLQCDHTPSTYWLSSEKELLLGSWAHPSFRWFMNAVQMDVNQYVSECACVGTSQRTPPHIHAHKLPLPATPLRPPGCCAFTPWGEPFPTTEALCAPIDTPTSARPSMPPPQPLCKFSPRRVRDLQGGAARPTHQDRHSPLTSSHRPPPGAQPSHGARPARGQAGHEPPPPPAAPTALGAGPARPALGPVCTVPGCSERPVRRRTDGKEAGQEG